MIYSSYNLGNITKVKVDLEKNLLSEKEILKEDLSHNILALEPVKASSLHEKLIKKSKDNKS